MLVLCVVLVVASTVFTDVLTPTGTTENKSFIAEWNFTEANLKSVKWAFNETNTTIYNSSLYDGVVINLQMNNYSSLGENSTLIYDISGNGNNGTMNENVTFSSGIYGSGAYYIEKEKENSRITVADSNSLDITGNLTVSMWVNLNAIQGSDTTLLSKYEGGYIYRDNYGIRTYDDAVYFEVGNGTGDDKAYANFDGFLTENEWVHIVGTYNGSLVSLYRDGVLKDTTPFSNPLDATNEPLIIGSNSKYDNKYNGSIDNVIIWNRSLSIEEISQLYNDSVYKYDNNDWVFYANESMNTNTTGISYDYYLCSSNSSDSENCTTTKTITRIPESETITGNFTNLHKTLPNNNPIGVSITSCGLGNSSNADSRYTCFLDTGEVNYLPSYHLSPMYNRTWYNSTLLDLRTGWIRNNIGEVGDIYSNTTDESGVNYTGGNNYDLADTENIKLMMKFAYDNNINVMMQFKEIPLWNIDNSSGLCNDPVDANCASNNWTKTANIYYDRIQTITNNFEYIDNLYLEYQNEPYYSWKAKNYTDNINNYISYLHALDSRIKIGGGGCWVNANIYGAQYVPFCEYTLANMTGNDFITYHDYPPEYFTESQGRSLKGSIDYLRSICTGANCSTIIMSEGNVAISSIKNNTDESEYGANLASAFIDMMNYNASYELGYAFYQFAEEYRYNKTEFYPEYHQKFAMVTPPELLSSIDKAYYIPFNVSKAFNTYHGAGSTVYTSTSSSSAVKPLSTMNGSNHYITVINTDTEARNISVDTDGAVNNLFNLETGEEYVGDIDGVFTVGVMDSYDILYLGDNTNITIDIVAMEDGTYIDNGTVEISMWLRAINGLKNAAIFIYNETGNLVYTLFETFIGSPTEYLWNVTTSLGEGTYDWFVNVTDMSDDTVTSPFRSFTVDETIPSIELVSPTTSAGQVLQTNGIYLNISSSDSENHSVVNNVGMALWQRYNDDTATDYSGNNNDGVVNGSTSTIDGRLGKAYAFDGVDDEILTTDSDSLDITEQITISTWVKFETNNAFERIVAKSHTSAVQPYSMYALTRVGGTYHPTELDGQIRFELGQGGTQHIVHTTSIPTEGEWIHIVGTYNGTNMSLYYNGVLETSGQGIWDSDSSAYVSMSGAIDSNDMPLSIGSDGLGNNYFNGSIDDVIIYNRALTQNEISAMYSAGATQYDNNITYPVGALPYGEYNVTSYAQDWAGNINETESRLINLAFPVTLNSPANNTLTSSPVTFNCSAGIGVRNISLWNNFSGTWGLNDTINISSTYNYTGKSFDISGQMSAGTGITYDGSDFWIVDFNSDTVYKYNSAGTYTGTSFSVATQMDNPQGITHDGSDFWIVDNNNAAVYKYNSVGTYTGTSFSVAGETSFALGITHDGSNFWVTSANPDAVYKYNSVGTYTGTSFSVAGEIATARGITYDGSDFWVVDSSSDAVYKYNSSGTYTGVSFDTSIETTNPQGMAWDGSNLFLTSVTNVYEYSNSTNTTFTQTISDNELLIGIWNCQACDEDNACSFATENFTLRVDDSKPTIVVENPNGTLNYNYVGNNETFNVTFTDTNLSECWWNYNGTNISIDGCLTGVKNSTQFILEYDNLNMTIYANDSFGNLLSVLHSWEYKVFKVSETYSNETKSGVTEDFLLNLTLGNGYDIASVSLVFNGTAQSTSITSSGQDRVVSVTDFEIPQYEASANISFYWNLILDDLTEINTSENIIFVENILLDNCSSYTYRLFNLSLFDEEAKTPIYGDIEFNFDLLNTPGYEIINSINISLINITTAGICSDVNLSQDGFYKSVEIRYLSDGYAPELYHIQRAEIGSDSQSIRLFDLNNSQSTEFKITYQDDTFNFVDDAIIQLQRKYISEGIYEVVEAPLTSRDGVTVVHIDLDSIKYKATVVKNGVVLDTFDNLVFNCDSELTGECTQKLLGGVNPQNSQELSNLIDFSYSVSSVNNTITTAFTVPSGTPSTINILLKQVDSFETVTLCNSTISSSAGSIDCDYNETIGDSSVYLTVSKDGEIYVNKGYFIAENTNLGFAGNNYLIVLILLLTLVGMAFASPEWIVIIGIVALVVAGGLWLINGMNLVIGLGMMIFAIMAAVVLIMKMTKQEDQ